MNFAYDDLLSIQEILADVLVELDDEAQERLTPGYYRTQVKKAADELGFETLFVDDTRDFPMPDDMMIELPSGVFNLKRAWAYTGDPDDVQYVQPLYWKRNYDSRGYQKGYTADIHESNVTDPFSASTINDYVLEYYFNVRQGMLTLSDTCVAFDFVRIQFSGTPSAVLDVEKVKIVPPFAAEAVTLWVVEKCARALKSRNAKYRQIQIDAANQLDKFGFNGAWQEAKRRLRAIDKKQMHDLMEYESKMEY